MGTDVITIRKPDDMHVHFRTGKMCRDVVPFTASVFARAVAMGNLSIPIESLMQIIDYREKILSAKSKYDFEPIMAVMLTGETTIQSLDVAWRVGRARVLKFIPGTASTGGAEGMDLWDLYVHTGILKAARDRGMVFSCHFERTTKDAGKPISLIDQEREAIIFAEEIVKAVPGLKMVIEHASTREMISFVEKAPRNVAATLTAHHAILKYSDVCDENGVIYNPFYYCKPIAKREEDRLAVVRAMTSGNEKFFFGSDSAPHLISNKLGGNPPAGIFTAPVALPLLCQIFEEQGKLERLENFTSAYGANFYGLGLNKGTVEIKREPWTVPDSYEGIKLFMGGRVMKWKVNLFSS